MIERWIPKLKKEQCSDGMTLRMWTDPEGDYVLYSDHKAALAEKERELALLKCDLAETVSLSSYDRIQRELAELRVRVRNFIDWSNTMADYESLWNCKEKFRAGVEKNKN